MAVHLVTTRIHLWSLAVHSSTPPTLTSTLHQDNSNSTLLERRKYSQLLLANLFLLTKTSKEESPMEEHNGEETPTNQGNGEACQETIKVQEHMAKKRKYLHLSLSSSPN